jgi:hypothetical protein
MEIEILTTTLSLAGIWAWAFGVDEEQQREADKATQWSLQRNFQLYQEGKISKEEYEAAAGRLNQNLSDSAKVDEQIRDEFVEGAKEGAQNIANITQGITDFGLSTFWKIIPWQVKVAAVIVVAYYVWSFYKTGKTFKSLL